MKINIQNGKICKKGCRSVVGCASIRQKDEMQLSKSYDTDKQKSIENRQVFV